MSQSTIRKLEEKDMQYFSDIVANAYPGWGFNGAEDREKLLNRLITTQNEVETVNLYGVFKEDKLVGGMRLHDFNMNLLSQKVKAGGLGLVAVDLMHKKEKIAKGIVTYFLRHYREMGAPIAMLYPFRPDFYKKMGFGFGTKLNQYSIKPADLPSRGDKTLVRFAVLEDQHGVWACYNTVYEQTNGVVERAEKDFPGVGVRGETRVAVYEKEGRIQGYMAFSFRKVNDNSALKNDIDVKEMIYENSEVLLGLMAFLHTQSDQIHRITFTLQDEYFHHLFADPRNGTDYMLTPVYHETNVQGVGIMYRVIDMKALFEGLKDHDFGGQSCKLKITIKDSFLPENEGSTVVHFINGKAHLENDGSHEAEIIMDVADFSSMVVGAVNFKTLLGYGLAQISDGAYEDTVQRIFRVEEKPVCYTMF